MPNTPATGATALRVEGLATDYPAGEMIQPHQHDAHQIVHAIAGVARVFVAGAVWIVPPGRGLWVPARVTHAIRCVGALHMRTVYLEGAHPSFPQDVRVVAVSALLREIITRLAQAEAAPAAAARQHPHLVSLLIEEIAQADIAPLRLPSPRDPRIRRIAEALLENPAEAGSLDDWADRLGMSRRSLIRHIRQETGMTYRELRRQARVAAGLERLALGRTVTQAAFDVGFDSPSAFIQAFRVVTGSTPGRVFRPGR